MDNSDIRTTSAHKITESMATTISIPDTWVRTIKARGPIAPPADISTRAPGTRTTLQLRTAAPGVTTARPHIAVPGPPVTQPAFRRRAINTTATSEALVRDYPLRILLPVEQTDGRSWDLTVRY